MDTDYIIEHLRFEILRPYHNPSRFKSRSEKLNRFIKDLALEEQEDENKVTHLVLCEDEIVAFFSICVDFDGMPIEDYSELRHCVPDVPSRSDFPHAKIKRFAIDQRFECDRLAAVIFDNIVYNLKNIFKKHSGFHGIAISVGDSCLFPDDDDCKAETDDDCEKRFVRFTDSDGDFIFTP